MTEWQERFLDSLAGGDGAAEAAAEAAITLEAAYDATLDDLEFRRRWRAALIVAPAFKRTHDRTQWTNAELEATLILAGRPCRPRRTRYRSP